MISQKILRKLDEKMGLIIQLGRVPGGLGWIGLVGNIPSTLFQLAGAGSIVNL